MNKENIKNFITKFEEEKDILLFTRDDDNPETFASGLLMKYLETVGSVDEVYDDFIRLLNFILSGNR